MLLLVACAALVAAQDSSGDATKTKIIALEKAWNQAYKMGDVRALSALLDSNIVLINDDGSIQSKDEFLKGIKATASQEQQVSPESLTVQVMGNVAIATGVFRAKGNEGRKSYIRRERFVDTWINKNGNWVCVASNATPILH